MTIKKPKALPKNTIIINVSETATYDWFVKTIKAQAKELEPYVVEFHKPYSPDAQRIALECVRLGCKVKMGS